MTSFNDIAETREQGTKKKEKETVSRDVKESRDVTKSRDATVT